MAKYQQGDLRGITVGLGKTDRERLEDEWFARYPMSSNADWEDLAIFVDKLIDEEYDLSEMELEEVEELRDEE